MNYLLSVSEAAAIAKMSPQSMRRWLRQRMAQFPELVQGSAKRWLIQRTALGLALGASGDIKNDEMLDELAIRLDALERRVHRLENASTHPPSR